MIVLVLSPLLFQIFLQDSLLRGSEWSGWDTDRTVVARVNLTCYQGCGAQLIEIDVTIFLSEVETRRAHGGSVVLAEFNHAVHRNNH